MNQQKILLIVIDGIAGKIGKITALKKAKTPNLDFLAEKAKTGLMYTVPGIAPESDSAVLALLGYDPFRYYTGRGPLEANGTDVVFKKGMLALRCNFATVIADDFKIIDRRAGRTLTTTEAKQLEKEINKIKLKNAEFVFRATAQHRGVLIIKAKKELSEEITNTDPAYERTTGGISKALQKFEMKVKKSHAINESAKQSADLVNEFTEKVFKVLNSNKINKKRIKQKKLPANMILCRDAGNELPNLFSISKKYHRKSAIIADMPLEIGIGKLADLKVIKLSKTGFSKKDYDERVTKTANTLKENDFVYVHIKGPDLFGHDGDFKGKVKSIEDVDKYFIGPVLKKIDMKNIIIAVTADHATPCFMKSHSKDPVPLMIHSEKIKKDAVKHFSEDECFYGSIKIKGKELIPLLMKL